MEYTIEAFAEFWEYSRFLLWAILPLAALNLILTGVALVNLIKKPVSAGNKTLWLLVITLINTIGPIIYLAVGSKQLDDKSGYAIDN